MLASAAALAVAILARGIAWGTGNHAIHVSLIRRLVNPAVYPGDPLFDHLAGYATCFHAVFAGLGLDESGLFLAFIALTPVCVFVCLTLMASLTGRAGGDLTSAFIACVGLGLGYNPSVGRSPFDLELTPALPGFVGGLLALWLYRRGRSILAFLLAGLTVNVHALYGAFVLLLLGIASLIEAPRDWKRHTHLVVAGFGAALPVLLLYTPPGDSVSSLDAWLAIQRVRSPHHIFPSEIGVPDWIGLLTFLLLALRPWRPAGERKVTDPIVLAALFVSIIAVGLALAFTEWIPLPAVVRLQPLRATVWLYLAALPCWAIAIAEGIRQARPSGAMMAASLFAGSFLTSKSLAFLAFGGVATLAVCRWARFRRLASLIEWGYLAGVATAALVGPVLAAIGVPAPPWLPRSPTLLIPLVASTVIVVTKLTPMHRRAGDAAWCVLAMVALTVVSAGIARRDGSLLRLPDAAWSRVQEWARTSSPEASVFLFPPYREGFRVGSWRAQYVDWKDGTLGLFNADFALLWWQRMNRLGISFDPLAHLDLARNAYGRLDQARICGLARLDRLDYFITEDAHQAASFPLVHQDPPFYVRRIACDGD